jgi:ubiquinone/menaquinone biosynthesis C-methylase UbiE
MADPPPDHAHATTREAEKHYVSIAGTERWERVKPFSTPGYDDVAQSAHLIHDFAVALACLRPRPGERVLDVGAGSCWVSEWLRRLNVCTISIDLSEEMLRIGRQRLGSAAWIIAGDFEQLPLANSTVDKAICLNAFHHVPDGGAALRELFRVLRPGGEAFFSEPGEGHSDAPSSATAVQQHGVQERDVLVSQFTADCGAAGFINVRLKPLVGLVSDFDIPAERWTQWERLADSRRPRRALAKIVRGCLEIFGLGKQGPLFEEALGMELTRVLRQTIQHHPMVVVSKPR